MKEYYETAVCELLAQGVTVSMVLEGLKKTLKKNGHTALHVQVLRGAITKLEQAQKATTTSIRVADEADVAKLKQAITASLKKLEGNYEDAIITIDKTLVGGYIATHNGHSIDVSHKGKLVQLYRNITA
jgi:F0F1-type ATP synthase delta subunit